MRIQHNIAALNSYRNLSNNNTAVSKNLEKLSSGYKINRAGDDAAGLAISEKMRAQITGLETAQKNAQDGISLVQTAEGALTEVHSMLNRMVELANQSANGTYQDEVDRENLQKEINSLVDEIDRISKSTNFNGINLLDGTMGAGNTGTGTASDLITGQLKSDAVKTLTTGSASASAVYEIDFDGIAFGKDGTANVKFGNFNVDVEVTKDMTAEDFAKAVAKAINESPLGTGASGASLLASAPSKFTATADGTKVILEADAVGTDSISGITTNTKVSVTDKAEAGEEIKAPSVSITGNNDAKLGDVKFEFAKDATDEMKKAFIEMLDSDGLSLTISANATATGANAAGKITIDTAIFEALGEDFKLQYIDATGKAVDVPSSNGEITIGTDSSSDVGKIHAGEDMKFQITDKSGKVIGTITVGALTDKTDSPGSTTIAITPSKTEGAEGAEPQTFVARKGSGTTSSAPKFTKDDAGYAAFGIKDIDFSEFTGAIASDTEVTMEYNKDTNVLTVKIGDATFTSAALASNATELQGKEIELTSENGGKITVNMADSDVKIGTGTSANIESTKVGTLSPASSEGASDVKKGDKYEMDFSTLSNPKNGDVLQIGDIKVTFQNGKAVAALANGTSINVTIGKDINETMSNLAAKLNETAGFKENWKVTADNGKLTFEAQKDGVSIPKVGSGTTWTGADKVTAKPVEDDSTATDAPQLGEGITLQIGDSSAEYNRITVTIGDMSAAALGIEGLDISTQASAMEAIDKIKAAINKVSSTRGDLGAIQNRLEHTINNLSVTTENMTAAESRIRDVDMAKEMMAYTKNNILVQSSQAMLAQANQIPQGVLQLLQ